MVHSEPNIMTKIMWRLIATAIFIAFVQFATKTGFSETDLGNAIIGFAAFSLVASIVWMVIRHNPAEHQADSTAS